ncbi:MAG: CcoQ/FixQ family Cbb3-type cytochrome c oxidase assembly chaperone [Rhodobacterales bacterium]|nr:MAG: CcoQ/FixQ family Cbb3-type cytochrome c oxidase assembly chaperone [Rhodobacterales bacterium]
MDTYSIFREIADSWVLLAMFLFFVGCILWVFRPGSRKVYQDTADIPFRHENKPAGEGEDPQTQLKGGTGE